VETAQPGTNESETLGNLALALDLVLPSESLEALCKRTVTLPALNNTFDGAHVLLNTNSNLNYDCGYGLPLPTTHETLAHQAIATQQIQFAAETPSTRAMVAIPFIHDNIAEAVGIVLLHPGAQDSYIHADLEPALKKLTGFYLATTVGLDH
jgi:hypothetical protein